jgi:hypothetical protein
MSMPFLCMDADVVVQCQQWKQKKPIALSEAPMAKRIGRRVLGIWHKRSRELAARQIRRLQLLLEKPQPRQP